MNKNNFNINNIEQNDIGFMIDLSRGKVLKIEELKKMAYFCKTFGYTYINVYLEDLLTLEEYPQFGYMRGKYSDQEIIELVEYCEEIGIEIFPAIQTLGHLEHFLRWNVSDSLRDTPQVLNVVNGEGIKFVRILLEKCRKLFPSSKINIGMDEAFDLGQGSVFRSGNALSQKELYFNHLEAVVDICKELGYDSIKIWSDMLFNIYSGAGAEGLYSMDLQTKVDSINDDVEIIFWNYWTQETDQYEQVIDMHHKFSDNVSMALGVHTWGLPFYNSPQLNISEAAIKACDNKNIEDILFTMWGDDGSIYNLESAYYGIYLTACLLYDQEPDDQYFEEITNLKYSVLEIVAKISNVGINPLLIIWNDPITNIQLKTMKSELIDRILKNSEKMLIEEVNDTSKIYNLYLKCIKNDIEIYRMKTCDDKLINKAKAELFELFKLIEKQWLVEAKINGIEEIQLRFLAKINRYQFLLDNFENNDIVELRNEALSTLKEVPHNYNGVSKATMFRW